MIGDRGEPCGVPSGTLKGVRVVESNRMEAERSVRKEKNPFYHVRREAFLLKDVASSVGVDVIEEAKDVEENEGGVIA